MLRLVLLLRFAMGFSPVLIGGQYTYVGLYRTEPHSLSHRITFASVCQTWPLAAQSEWIKTAREHPR
jgi:hypothetical protein